MHAIKAIYDGKGFKPKEPIPVNGEYEVIITFTAPIIKQAVNEKKRFSSEEKEKITKSLFGVLPSDIDEEHTAEAPSTETPAEAEQRNARRHEAFNSFMQYKGTLPEDFDYKKELEEYRNERYGNNA
jgi:predicted DNA-binding antitoxin AbrB/MazE fold protein